MDRHGLIADVAVLLREAAGTAILPVFRRLGDGEVTEKTPGEVVTVADHRAEEIITAGLRRLLPGSVVVGEEGVAADPDRLAHLRGSAPVWLVDPLDGTANFAAGHAPFAVMVALLERGEIELSWILDPLTDTLAVARAGGGARVDGAVARTTGAAPPLGELRGAVMSRFLPPELRASVEGRVGRLGGVSPGERCAGHEYPGILAGRQDFALFWRTLPWDHAPGVLLVREAGGVARRFDGSPYDPADERTGLLVAANEEIWDTVRAALLEPDGR